MTADPQYKPATFLRRLLAMFYDAILVAALIFIASAISLLVNGGKTAGESSLFIQISISLWLLAVAFFYYGLSWTVSGQTLGLRTWHMRVLDEKGDSISWSQAVLRFITAIIGMGTLWMLLNKDQKSLQDKASKSQIVDERKFTIK